MREEIQNLAKAAVTALIRSDPSALAIEGGKLAIDRLFGWLPQKGKLDALIARVEGELKQLAEVEFQGGADLEPAIGNATILFQRFGLTATELVDLSLEPDRATEELLERGKEVLRAAGEAVAELCRGRIVPRVHHLLLDDPQTIAELSPELAIDPAAPDHVLDPQAALLVERHVAHATGLGLAQVVAAGIAAVGGARRGGWP